MKKARVSSALAWMLLVLLLVGCAGPAPCGKQSKDFIAEVEQLLDDWDDANALASQTSRIALSPVIASLQEIRRKVHDLQPPECASYVQDAFERYMDAVIDGYMLFMAQKSDSQVSTQFSSAQGLQDSAIRWLAELKTQQ